MLVVHMLWSLPWIALAIMARRRTKPEPMSARSRQVLWALVAAGVLATFVLLGSPKVGRRLYVHSVALIAMGLSGAVVAQLTTQWARKAAAALAIVVLIYVEVRCVVAYSALGSVGAERVAIITGAAPGASVVVPRFSVGESNWFVGDDLGWEGTAAMWSLARIELAPK
jgi:hypothetical protein